MIIGLTGKNAAGKGEAANYLKLKGFVYYSLSDVIREVATERGLLHSRDNLINIGNELRTKFGAGCLAKRINEKIFSSRKNFSGKFFFVIDSIRSPYEVEELAKNRDFILVGIDAPIELRLERMVKRGRTGDAKTLKVLKEHEQRENLNKNTSQQLDATLKMAKFIVANDSSLEELHEKIDKLMKIISTQS